MTIGLLTDSFNRLHQSLGLQAGTKAEADRGHIKGMEFEVELYSAFARLGAQFDDDTGDVKGGDVKGDRYIFA